MKIEADILNVLRHYEKQQFLPIEWVCFLWWKLCIKQSITLPNIQVEKQTVYYEKAVHQKENMIANKHINKLRFISS